uniref:Uncharacterized protein LOC101489667 n=1 Tax=Cicer arietinum TaxID=3827 RepID=A0A1S2YQ62_CICAR|nr:uncharacterized protein LOC101489667 [Cicer arietinum]
MAPQVDLREIGLEGFDLIDKFYGVAGGSTRTRVKKNNNRVFPARQGRWVVHDEMEEPVVMNSKEVAARFGGIHVVDYFNGKKPQVRLW